MSKTKLSTEITRMVNYTQSSIFGEIKVMRVWRFWNLGGEEAVEGIVLWDLVGLLKGMEGMKGIHGREEEEGNFQQITT